MVMKKKLKNGINGNGEPSRKDREDAIYEDIKKLRPRHCEGCQYELAYPPSQYCPGCQAYQEHIWSVL